MRLSTDLEAANKYRIYVSKATCHHTNPKSLLNYFRAFLGFLRSLRIEFD